MLCYPMDHRCTRGGGGIRGYYKGQPKQIFEKFVKKNAIKPKIVYPPWDFVQKPLTHQMIWAKIWATPSPGLLTVCSND